MRSITRSAALGLGAALAFVPAATGVASAHGTGVHHGPKAVHKLPAKHPRPAPLPRSWILGTAGNDTLTGTAGNDHIWGFAGNDVITGGDGNDFISAGSGDDNVDAGAGNDLVFAGPGRDTINGGDGNDQLWALARTDVVPGPNGETDTLGDTLIGGAGNDVFHTRDGEVDSITCGDGNDVVLADTVDVIADATPANPNGSCEKVVRVAPKTHAYNDEDAAQTVAKAKYHWHFR